MSMAGNLRKVTHLSGVGGLRKVARLARRRPRVDLSHPARSPLGSSVVNCVTYRDGARVPGGSDLVDAVERASIRDKLSPKEILQLCELQFPQYTRQQLVVWIERFFRLWCRNQWKRERFAPSFHLDDENLDPKTW